MNLSRHDFRALGIVRAVVICVWMVLALCGCETSPQQTSTRTITQVDTYNTLFTCEHDGHKWVVLNGYHSGGLVHHPDCPCQKEVK